MPIFSCILIAAHFSRISNDWLAISCLIFPFLLFSKKEWVLRLFQVFLIIGGIIWLERMINLVHFRKQSQLPSLRLAIILTIVALFTFISAFVLNSPLIKKIFKNNGPGTIIVPVTTSLLTALVLSIVLLKVKQPVMILLERFHPGAGWVEVILLSIYAGWIAEKILTPSRTPLIRKRIWLLFSIVFFSQLLLGLVGIEKLLMTGKLHLPVPAMIIAGPLFRGSEFFMLILFLSTIILIGPAWCSYLCYIGAWDNLGASIHKIPEVMPKWRKWARLGILGLVVIATLCFRFIGTSGLTATIAGGIFGIIGVGIMGLISTRKGVMVHCTTYCPMGLLANLFGKLSPFRMRISKECTECGSCRFACRYDALTIADIKKRKPGFTCTLCGDCLHRCKENAIKYHFLNFDPVRVRYVFIIMVVSLHAVFLGVARL